MGFLWYPTGSIEAGIDGIIELRDPSTGETFNTVIQVQSKATEGQFQAETSEEFDYLRIARDWERTKGKYSDAASARQLNA
jgi:hypothetical protein